jgi:diguanylate cyclase (GGDEF)-like protein
VSVDRLRDVVEHEGRDVVDAFLHGAGQRLARLSRKPAVVARYDDDSFGVILPNTVKEGAVNYARRIKLALEGQPLGLEPLTSTIAVVSVPADATTLDAIVAKAEFRRLEGRRAGGNTIRDQ